MISHIVFMILRHLTVKMLTDTDIMMDRPSKNNQREQQANRNIVKLIK